MAPLPLAHVNQDRAQMKMFIGIAGVALTFLARPSQFMPSPLALSTAGSGLKEAGLGLARASLFPSWAVSRLERWTGQEGEDNRCHDWRWLR